jgi:hypothetical protein
MAINANMITVLRVLINDTESPQTYSDVRLEKMLVAAALYVDMEIDFNRDYTIDVGSPDISPDPMASGATDDDAVFANFIMLKAACIADLSSLRTRALQEGIKARCGPAVLEVMGHSKAFMALIENGPCAAYKALKWEHELGNAQACKAILSPFTGNNFDAQNLAPSHRYGHPHRRRMW